MYMYFKLRILKTGSANPTCFYVTFEQMFRPAFRHVTSRQCSALLELLSAGIHHLMPLLMRQRTEHDESTKNAHTFTPFILISGIHSRQRSHWWWQLVAMAAFPKTSMDDADA